MTRNLASPIELGALPPLEDPADTGGTHTVRLLYHAGLYATSAALLKIAGFVFFLWLARTLPIQEYATWGLLYALQTGVASFALVGIMEAVVGLLKGHATPDEQRRLFSAANHVFLITAGGSLVLALILGLVFVGSSGEVASGVAAVLASGSLLGYSSLQAQIVRLEEKHFASLLFNFIVPLGGLLGSFVAFLIARTVESFFWGSVVGLAAVVMAARARNIGFYGFERRFGEWRLIVARIAPFALVTFLGWLGGYGNNYVVKAFFDSTEVAKFTFAFMLSASMQLLATSMNQVWSPRFYRMIQSQPLDVVEAANRNFFRIQAVTVGLAGGSLIALYPLAVKLVGGNLTHYQSIGFELFLLVSAYLLVIPYWHCQNYLLAYDRGSMIMNLHIATSTVGVAVLVALMWLWGPLGIYIGFLAQMALRSMIALYISRRHWTLRIGWDGIAIGLLMTYLGFYISGSGLVH